jgi:hypothetical protein
MVYILKYNERICTFMSLFAYSTQPKILKFSATVICSLLGARGVCFEVNAQLNYENVHFTCGRNYIILPSLIISRLQCTEVNL